MRSAAGEAVVSARLMAMINVADRLRARAFYGDALGPVFGLGKVQIDHFGDQLACGDGFIRLTELADVTPGPHPVLGWQVDDASSCAAALAAHGVSLIIYPGMGQGDDGLWISPGGQARIGWFHDSEGNLLSFTQIS